ncbi:MAG TPA: FAD-dependent oxidoreductase [Opitutaceae bacterium]|nr:FAD-dependent oxidoreductase [Opitutaceae bacterium]
MQLLSSRPLWPLEDGLPDSYPPLKGDISCEAAVIGGGVTGAFLAWHLAEAGLSAVVLDRREAAHGSTAGSTSLLQYEIDEPLHRLARHFGPERAVRSYRRCRDAVEAIGGLVKRLRLECGFERKSSLLLASDRSHLPRLRREFEARRAAGFAVEWWPRGRLARESTLPQPAAILSREAAQVDAYRLAYGLLTAAQAHGVKVHDRTAVTHTRFRPRGVELRTSRGARVRARWLVVAAGYEAGSFLPEKVTALHSTYAVASEPVADFPGWPSDRCLIWETARPYVYLRTTPRGRLIIGGYDEPFRDPAARDRLLAAKSRLLRRRFRQLFPRIPFEMSCAWAGTFADTPHGLPFIGRHAQVPHTWFALGYGGNGITYSLLAAELVRDQMLGRKNSDEELFGFERNFAQRCRGAE